MGKQHSISIWFFIGSLLAVYGVLVLGAGVHSLIAGPPANVVLSNLHIEIWWGIGMLLLGGVYLVLYWPRRSGNG